MPDRRARDCGARYSCRYSECVTAAGVSSLSSTSSGNSSSPSSCFASSSAPRAPLRDRSCTRGGGYSSRNSPCSPLMDDGNSDLRDGVARRLQHLVDELGGIVRELQRTAEVVVGRDVARPMIDLQHPHAALVVAMQRPALLQHLIERLARAGSRRRRRGRLGTGSGARWRRASCKRRRRRRA